MDPVHGHGEMKQRRFTAFQTAYQTVNTIPTSPRPQTQTAQTSLDGENLDNNDKNSNNSGDIKRASVAGLFLNKKLKKDDVNIKSSFIESKVDNKLKKDNTDIKDSFLKNDDNETDKQTLFKERNKALSVFALHEFSSSDNSSTPITPNKRLTMVASQTPTKKADMLKARNERIKALVG